MMLGIRDVEARAPLATSSDAAEMLSNIGRHVDALDEQVSDAVRPIMGPQDIVFGEKEPRGDARRERNSRPRRRSPPGVRCGSSASSAGRGPSPSPGFGRVRPAACRLTPSAVSTSEVRNADPGGGRPIRNTPRPSTRRRSPVTLCTRFCCFAGAALRVRQAGAASGRAPSSFCGGLRQTNDPHMRRRQ